MAKSSPMTRMRPASRSDGRSDTYRRIRIESNFGKLTVLVTDGHLPYPYGRETTGYEVANLADTLAKAKAAGVEILVAPYTADQRNAAIVQFPGGYIAEIHSPVEQSKWPHRIRPPRADRQSRSATVEEISALKK